MPLGTKGSDVQRKCQMTGFCNYLLPLEFLAAHSTLLVHAVQMAAW